MELKNVEKQEKSIVALTIAVAPEELEVGKEKAFKKNRKNITVPGFRKGHAPRKMIEKMYGEGVFFEDAVNFSYPDAYDAAVKEAELDPVGAGEVEMSEIPEEGGYIFIAKVPVRPEVTLGEYKGIAVAKEEPHVLPEDVDAELKRMAQRTARTETVERPAKEGDTVVIDFDGSIDGTRFEGGQSENYSLVLGSGSFIPGFEEQLIGAKAGDEPVVSVTFPKDYHAAELAGKEAAFQCKVHTVQETVLPEMDDEFAKDVSETCETLDELKKEIGDKLLKDKTKTAEHDYEEALLDEVLKDMQAEIPDAMIESQIDTIVQDFGYRVQMQGMQLEQYVAMNGMDMPGFRKMFHDQAERQVRVRMALQKIAELENIEIGEEAIEEEYKKMAEQYGTDEEKVKKIVPEESVTADLKLNRAMELLKENATQKKTVKKTKKLEKAEDVLEEE